MNTQTSKQKPKLPNIGLRQAKRLCQMPQHERLQFIAEGLPIILDSAKGFWAASHQINDHPREANVLEGFAEEEAAKILILMDVVRCPPKLIASKLNKLIGWFYDHLARLIYAKATTWRPVHLAQLREYVDQERRGHFIEGYAGEYILPNWTVYERESRLYADIESHQDDTLCWNTPRRNAYRSRDFLGAYAPPAIQIAEAMHQLGLFTIGGLQATSDIWGSLEYRDKENHREGLKLTDQLLERLYGEGLILDTAEREVSVANFAALPCKCLRQRD